MNTKSWKVYTNNQLTSPQKKYEDTLSRLAKFLEQTKITASR